MDAGAANLRNALSLAMRDDGRVPHWRETLARTCGIGDDREGAAETYVVTVGDWGVYAAPNRTWRVEIRPDRSFAQVSLRDAAFLLPPPDGDAYEYVAPVNVVTVPLGDLEPLRRMWNTSAAWQAPQRNPSCIHRRPARFEACVYGRYALRDYGCGPGAAGVDAVWQWLQARFPAPAPARLEPAG